MKIGYGMGREYWALAYKSCFQEKKRMQLPKTNKWDNVVGTTKGQDKKSIKACTKTISRVDTYIAGRATAVLAFTRVRAAGAWSHFDCFGGLWV